MEHNTNEIDRYIAGFPEEIQNILQAVRATIRKAAPDASETIAYGIPTFTLQGNLVHFAAFKQHIGFYPAPSGLEAFKDELAGYKGAKGSVQFPLDEAMPLDIIAKIVAFRVKENLGKAAAKKSKVFLPELSAPARRALESKGITSLKKLSACRESEIRALHGMGPSSIPKLKTALEKQGLAFKPE